MSTQVQRLEGFAADRLRSASLAFFAPRGHAVVPSASLVPENDPSVLFTSAGMQPLVPYLMGQPHPRGRRIADVQKRVRTGAVFLRRRPAHPRGARLRA